MEETKCFCYTFSKKTTEQILNGEAFLAPGGAKSRNGQMLEFGRPMILNKGENDSIDLEKDKETRMMIASCNKQLDLYDQKIEGIQKSLWLNSAALQQLSTITFDGFSCVIERLDIMSEDIKTIQKTITENHQNERLKELWKHISTVKSDIDCMSMKGFNASSNFMMMKNDIGEIMSFLKIVNKEFLEGIIDGELALSIISLLLLPYAFVVKSYSALYYYENDKYPMAYEDWVEAINEIAKNQKFRNRLTYCARLESNMKLEDKMTACKRVVFNLRAIGSDVSIDREYVLRHSKGDYLGREEKLIKKINDKEYDVINGHLLVRI